MADRRESSLAEYRNLNHDPKSDQSNEVSMLILNPHTHTEQQMRSLNYTDNQQLQHRSQRKSIKQEPYQTTSLQSVLVIKPIKKKKL